MSVITERIVASGHGSLSPIYFAVHSTGNAGATAANHVTYWSNNPDYAVHLVSDWKECYHTVPYTAKCWQVGNGNHTCEGIEICEATNESDFLKGMEIARAAILERLEAHGWTVDGSVRSHLWFTQNYGGSDHTDPIPYLNKWGWTWDDFMNYLKDGDDMPTADDIWNFDQNGTLMRDRIQGTDEAANLCRQILQDTSDPTGRGKEMTTHDHVKWIGAATSELTRTDDPTGRDTEAKLYDRICWMAAKQEAMMEQVEEILTAVKELVPSEK